MSFSGVFAKLFSSVYSVTKMSENSETMLMVERRLLSTPFRPSGEVMNEISAFLLRCLECRSYPMTKQVQEDVSVVRDSIECLLLTHSVRTVALSVEDMSLKVILTDNLSEAEVKLSQPIIALKPLSPDVKPVLTIETTGENPKLTDTLLECKHKLKVLVVDLKGNGNSITASLEEIFFEVLPKLGLKTDARSEDLDSLCNILEEYRTQIKALTLAAEGIQIAISSSLVQDPERIKNYANLFDEIPKETNEWDLGVLSDIKIENRSWVETSEKPRRQVSLGVIEDKEQLFSYTLRRR
jgi:hypothetical protein